MCVTTSGPFILDVLVWHIFVLKRYAISEYNANIHIIIHVAYMYVYDIKKQLKNNASNNMHIHECHIEKLS